MSDLKMVTVVCDGSKGVEIPWNLYSKGFDIIWMNCTRQYKY